MSKAPQTNNPAGGRPVGSPPRLTGAGTKVPDSAASPPETAVYSQSGVTGKDRPTTPFEGSIGPETKAAVRATRSVLKAIAEVEQRRRARRGSVKADFEAAVIAVLCAAAVDLLERGGQGFR